MPKSINVDSLKYYCGQTHIIPYLLRQIEGSKKSQPPIPIGHLLFSGPSGVGKTALAEAIAREMNTNFHYIFGSSDTKVSDIIDTLMQAKPCDIVFLDEAHSLKRDAQQILYEAIDKGWTKSGHGIRHFKPFTVIAATDQPGILQKAFEQRLRHFPLNRYTLDEMKRIVRKWADSTGVDLTREAVTYLAKAANGMPRSIVQHIEDLNRRFPTPVAKLNVSDVRQLLSERGIDERFLGEDARKYLVTLNGLIGNRVRGVAIGQLSTLYGADGAYIRSRIEPPLLQKRLIFIGPNGRMLTEEGKALAQEIMQDKGAKIPARRRKRRKPTYKIPATSHQEVPITT